MPVGMTFSDISAVLTEINKLATGNEATSQIVKTSDFVSVAEATLRTGYDNYTNAISQMLSRTIFSVRPYNSIAPRLQMDAFQYGNHVRKINFFDKDPVTDSAWNLQDGKSVDMYEVNKPKQLQTNFYGQTNYSRVVTKPDMQINAAFSGPDQFAQWWTAILQHMSNQIEQDKQGLTLNLLANLMCGIPTTSPSSVVYLLDEYNALTGLSLTPAQVYSPDHYADFARYAFGRIADISDLISARTINWHQNWEIGSTNYNFVRQTPPAMQRLYLYSGEQKQIQARVLSTTFNQDLLTYGDYQSLPFFQNPNPGDRNTVSALPIVTSTAGAAEVASKPTQLTNVFGLLTDYDAIGYSPIMERVVATPLNARGLYTNFWYHYNYRWFNDFTENSVLFLLTSGDITHPEMSSLSRVSRLKSSTVRDPEPTVQDSEHTS